MKFNVGDNVVHPAYGVGRIAEIEEKQFIKKEKRLYYKFIWPERTVWIPVEDPAITRLRFVTAKSDLDQYRDLIRSSPLPLPEKHYHRHLELVSRLKQSSFQVVCEIVRDLTARGRRKPLGPTDRATLQRTQEKLHQEWAMASGLSTTEAIKEIDALLQTSQQAFMG